MAIQKLPKEVRSAVRNGITISSCAQCVTELVLNSLDASANAVVIHLDLPRYKLKVVDNGCGINLEDLKRTGIRYNTSKCQSLADIQKNLKYYGYRGEALASLVESCGTLAILSRHKIERPENTYCKIFDHGKPNQPSKSVIRRACAGTTISVHDFMYNAPVRQKRINPKIDLEEVRRQIEALALAHPRVSFVLKDDSEKSVVLNIGPCHNTLEIFSKLYGKEIASQLCPVGPYKSGKLSIHGFISKSSHYNKRLQFIFVNGRLVKRTKVHKLINMIMRKSDVLRGNGPWQELPMPERVRDFLWVSPMKKKDRYCVFLIMIDCPLSEYDITMDPRKTFIEFSDWDGLLESTENLVKDFLKKHKLACVELDTEKNNSDNGSTSSLLEEMKNLDEEDALGHKLNQFRYKNVKDTDGKTLNRMIKSIPAKRLYTKPCDDIKSQKTDEKDERHHDKGNISLFNRKETVSHEENGGDQDKINESLLNRIEISPFEDICSKKDSSNVEPHNITDERPVKDAPIVSNSCIPQELKPVRHKRKANKIDPESDIDNSECGPLGRFRKLYRQKEKIFAQETLLNAPTLNLKEPTPIRLKGNETMLNRKEPSSTEEFCSKNNCSKDRSQLLNDDPHVKDPSIVNNTDVSQELKSVQQKIKTHNTDLEIDISECGPLGRFRKLYRHKEKILAQKTSPNAPTLNLKESNLIGGNGNETLLNRKENSSSEGLCSKNNCSEERCQFLNDDPHIKENSDVPKELKSVQPKIKTHNPGSESEIDISECGPLGRFRKLYRQKQKILPKETPSNAPALNLKEPPPIVRRKVPLEHRIKSVIFSKKFRSTGTNTLITSDVCEHKSKCLFKNSLTEGSQFEGKSWKNFNEHNCISSSKPFINKIGHSEYFGKIRTTVSVATQTETGLTSLEPEREGLLAESAMKPNLKNLNSKRKYFQEFLNNPMDLPSKFDFLDRDSENTGDIILNSCPNSSCTSSKPSFAIERLNIPSTQDFLVTKVMQEKTVHIGSGNGIDGIHVNIDRNVGIQNFNGNEAAASGISFLKSKDSCGFSVENSLKSKFLRSTSSLQSHHWYNISKSSVIDNSDRVKSQLKQFPFLKSRTESSVSNIGSDNINENIDAELSTVKQKSSISENHAFPETLTDTLLSDPQSSRKLTTTECGNQPEIADEGEILIENSLAIEAMEQGQNSSNCSTERRSSYEHITDSLSKKLNVFNPSHIHDDENIPSSRKNVSSDCNEDVNACKSFIEVENDVTSSKMSADVRDSQKDWSFFEDASDWDMALMKHYNELRSRNEIIDNVSQIITISPEFGEKAAKKDNIVNEERFEMVSRPPFFPKGLSPVLSKLPPLECSSINPKNKKDTTSANEFLGEIQTINDEIKNSVISDFVSDANNKKYYPECDIMSIYADTHIKSSLKMFSLIQPCTFSKKGLTGFKMLGRLDNKFIITRICMNKNNASNAIVLFDQHAVHERIRLEKLTRDYQIPSTGSTNSKIIKYKSMPVAPALEILLDSNEVRMMESFEEHFQRVGLYFEKSREKENSDGQILVNFFGIPSCLSSKDAKELGPLGLKEQIHALIREQIENLVITRGIGTFAPGILRDAINMEACRGAVKFGDSISNHECRWLLRKLAACDSPFQCAHGRPSMYPIADTKHLDKYCGETEQENFPRLQKLKAYDSSLNQISNQSTQSLHNDLSTEGKCE